MVWRGEWESTRPQHHTGSVFPPDQRTKEWMASAVDLAPTVVRCKERMDEKAENEGNESDLQVGKVECMMYSRWRIDKLPIWTAPGRGTQDPCHSPASQAHPTLGNATAALALTTNPSPPPPSVLRPRRIFPANMRAAMQRRVARATHSSSRTRNAGLPSLAARRSSAVGASLSCGAVSFLRISLPTVRYQSHDQRHFR